MKITFKLFLIVCGSIVVLCNSCKKRYIDCVIKIEFVYTNQTDHTVRFEALDTMRVILPNSTNNVITVDGDGPKKINPEPVPLPYLFHYEFNAEYDYIEEATLCIDDTCMVVEQKGFAQSTNYQYEVLGDRHIRYIYTFTDAEIEELLK